MPIAGAIVVVRWVGNWFMDGEACSHVETAVSDQEGRYRVPRWWQVPRWWLAGSEAVAVVYQRGYQDVWSHTEDAEAHPDDVYMKRFLGTDSERFDYISGRVFRGMDCGPLARVGERNLLPLHKAAIQEAKELAHSKEQQQTVQAMRRVAAYDWLAPIEPTTVMGDPLDRLPHDIRKALE